MQSSSLEQTEHDNEGDVSLVAFADIFGFSAIVAAESKSKDYRGLHEVQMKLQDCCEQVKALALRSDLKFYAISDCFFLVKSLKKSYSERVKSLKATHDVVVETLSIFRNRGFHLRGAVTVGEVNCVDSNILLGMPVVRAVRLEQSIRAPLIIFPEAEALQLDAKVLASALPLRPVVIPTKEAGRTSAYIFGIRDKAELDQCIADAIAQRNKYYRIGPPQVALAFEEAVATLDQLDDDTQEIQ